MRTRERSPEERRGAAWAITLSIVLLVELVTLAAGASGTAPTDQGVRFYHPGVVPTFTESVTQWQTRRVLDLPRAADVIFLGDSSVLMGIIPERMEREVGRDVENFGMIQTIGIDGHVDLLVRYLETHAPPEILVYYFSDGTLSQLLDEGSGQEVRDAYREWLGFPGGVKGLWPTARARSRARTLWAADWYEATPKDEGVREFIFRHQGFVRSTQERAALKEVPIGYNEPIEPQLLRFFRVAEEHGIRLFLMHAPMADQYDRPDNRRRHAVNERLLVELAASFPAVRVVLPFARYAPTEAFVDYEHLSLRGAQINTLQVSRWLKTVLER